MVWRSACIGGLMKYQRYADHPGTDTAPGLERQIAAVCYGQPLPPSSNIPPAARMRAIPRARALIHDMIII